MQGLDVGVLKRGLAGSQLAFELRAYALVASTQDLVGEAARAGAPEGLVVFADEQSAGRGRAGRSWTAPAGSALMFSILLRPAGSVADWASLSLVGGLAVVEGLALVGGPKAELKWPNDCLCGGRKLAGVLAESVTGREGDQPVVLGVGCNLKWEGLEVPKDLRESATACDLEGAPVDRTELAAAVLERMADRYRQWQVGGFAAVREDWLTHATWLGEEVVAEHQSGRLAGRALTVSEAGELILETPPGPVVIAAGELVRLRTPQDRPGVAGSA
ncbi:MAG: biotin--[acetyl-CoA-carboxylase] ligase [Candidatus Dormiibacterota bacterium]